ncbi:MAG: DUF5723 family protein [Tannerellaceae bacterium]|jgi:hypothetical protein|nr:DUF5723 family protein [Tannerellaceae bacterium]
MKRYIIISVLAMFAGTTLVAQSARTDYFLSNSYSRQGLNPAFMPRQGYIGIPGLSDLTVEANTNALYLDNFLFDRNGEKVTFMHPLVSSSEFLSKLPGESSFTAGMNYQPLSFGFYAKDGGFWSFGVGVKALVDVTIPKPLFELMKIGFTAGDQTLNYPIRDLNLSLTGYTEVSVGHARTFLDNRLAVGAKAKLLLGVADLDLDIETLDVSIRKDLWTARSKATLNGSGMKAVYDENGLFETVETNDIGVTGYGFALDLGAVYSITDKAKVSLAVTDLGILAWSGSSAINMKAPETQVSVTPGGNSSSIGGGEESEGDFDFKENLDNTIDDIMEVINFKQSGKAQGRTTMLYSTVNAGVEYVVLPEEGLSAGILSSTRLGSVVASELTLSANYNPGRIKWLSAALSYSFLNGGEAFGLALHIAPKRGVHFFVASDYLMPKVSSQFLPVSSSIANIQFGLAIPIGQVHD